jgi:translation elongation factor P/translation initiation factor 5A
MKASEIERGMKILIDDKPREIVNVFESARPARVMAYYYDDENVRTNKQYDPDDDVEEVVDDSANAG